jgi:hypothetical protein
MHLALAIIVLLVFALSFVADYKWRKWMARGQTNHNRPDQPLGP